MFQKGNQMYAFPCCKTRKDLSIDVSFSIRDNTTDVIETKVILALHHNSELCLRLF